MKKIILGLMLALSVFSAQADSGMESFNKRFKLIKGESGEVKGIKMKLFAQKFSIRPYVKQIVDDVKAEIARMQSKDGIHEAELTEFIQILSEGEFNHKSDVDHPYYVERALRNLKDVDIDSAVDKVWTSGVLQRFEKELSDALFKFDLGMIAALDDSRYFYRRNVTYEVVTRLLNFAKKKFDNIPLLNVASFVIVKVHDLILEQRLFHQNMLLFYLENYSETELGLTKQEADHSFSSIYESRISAMNLPGSRTAIANWDHYGTDQFYTMVRSANTALRNESAGYSKVHGKLNFGFALVEEDGKRVIKNLVNKKFMFSRKLANSFYPDEPSRVARFRSLLNLGQVALSFIPISGNIKAQVDSFIESFYVEQKRTEGALFGYFEANGDLEMTKIIQKQLINPYILL
jgi:hypothetical protein